MNLYAALIIDDEKHVRLDVGDALDTSQLFTVVGAYSTIEAALEFLREESKVLDFIFCDIQFEKGMSGIEGAEELRKYCRFFVFFTGHFEDYLLENALLKPDGFLSKPVQLEDIQELMAHLGLRQSLKPIEQIIYVMEPSEKDVDSGEQKTKRRVRPRIPIQLKDVVKVEREGKFLHIYGAGAQGTLVLLGQLRMALKGFYAHFQKLDIFIPPNSSVLINVAFTTSISIHAIVYYHGRQVLVTDGYRRKIRDYQERNRG
ncbi:LytR/AlgR family response regulator transcription factor [Sphingobacterium faecale]|uniref:Response regulator n=1 Tax=Sphingobacterium faecale TaxID=2803775 RepID=A0ABS1QYL4_9SPHI|nr:response regulator [Sphingobacterium faecale]MBL1407523.1 response regulator [Sphingobacterium faecale]